MSRITETLLDCLDAAEAVSRPYRYWLLDDVLTADACAGITDLPVAPPRPELHDGTREVNNQTRTYFNPDLQSRFPVCREIVDACSDMRTIDRLERLCVIDLSKGNLRIEYTQDTDGFWLEPHTDIGEKMFTMLVYLSPEPELADAGTDIYDGDHNHVGRAPFAPNRGLIFIPAADTWHGFEPRPIRGVRRSIIVNYVTDNWRDRWQLAA